MASTAPLLDVNEQHHHSSSLAVRLKAKAHQWRERSHEHALDHAMALGFRDMHTARHVEKHWGKDEGDGAVDLQTNTEAVTNLLNNCLGSGVLAVPFAVKNLGVGMGIAALMFSALLNRYTLLLIIKCCELADIEVSYNKLGAHAFGQAGRLMVIFCFVFMGFGCMVSYVDATADTLGGLLKAAGFDKMPMYKYQLMALFTLFPATYIRSLKSVATLSMIAFVGALAVVFCINFSCGSVLFENGLPDMSGLKWYETDPQILFSSIPTCLTVFSIQAGGSIILSTLKDHTEANISKVASVTKCIAWLVIVSVGVPVYLVFQDSVKSNALSAFDGSDPVIIIAKLAVLDMVILSYMFMMIPCRVALIELFFEKNEAKMEATQAQFLGVTTVVNFAAVGTGMMVSDLSVVIGLIGAIGVNLVAFVMPFSIYMKVRANPKTDAKPVPVMSRGNVPYFLMIAGALFLMVSGVTTIAINMMHPPAVVIAKKPYALF